MASPRRQGIRMAACGLDFGTSNSAIGVVRQGAPVLAPLEGGDTLIPSAVFFDYENTALGSKMVALTEVVELFVRHLKERAQVFAGEELTAVVHGRPVRFVDDDDEADAKAQRVLGAIANRVGFRDVAFVYEPIAAAYHYEQSSTDEEIVLIADIGGGTSDFTVIRIGPERARKPDRTSDILANDGVRVGGTDFDSLLS